MGKIAASAGLATLWLLLGFLGSLGSLGYAQKAPAHQSDQPHAHPVSAPFTVLMLSDLHFDPFRDPAKVQRLAAAPVADWERILAAPASPDRTESYAALESVCRSKGEDADHELLASSLKAEKVAATAVKFVTVSGDLLVHQFDCRYRAVTKGEKGYSIFAAKTASYVIRSVRATFPEVPVYVAMGNNDSGCGDYKMDLHDSYLAGTSEAVTEGILPLEDRQEARSDYEAAGYYRVRLPGMTQETALLVIDDIFLSKSYTTCAGKEDSRGGAAIMKWLATQLNEARTKSQKVWILGHIPPGINVYGTLRKGNACNSAESYLQDAGGESLGGLIARNVDVVELAIFGHTHMDEMKLIREEGAEAGSGVPMKGVSAISPVNGNMPSFTVARVDPTTSTLADFAIYVAPARSGGAVWKEEYSFDATYKQASFSSRSVGQVIAGFHADPDGAAAASAAYERFFMAGFPISPLVLGWPQYGCGMDHITEAAFKACACPSGEK